MVGSESTRSQERGCGKQTNAWQQRKAAQTPSEQLSDAKSDMKKVCERTNIFTFAASSIAESYLTELFLNVNSAAPMHLLSESSALIEKIMHKLCIYFLSMLIVQHAVLCFTITRYWSEKYIIRQNK